MDNSGGYSLSGHKMTHNFQRGRLQLRQGFLKHRIVKIIEDMEHVASISCGGFNRQDI